MTVTVIPAEHLTDDLSRAWAALQEADPGLHSPYFRPEFTLAVAAARGGAEVAVLEDAGSPVGFFPFQRGRGGIGRPVGWPMCDYQGVVARQGLDLDPDRLVRACGLAAWDFDHVPAALPGFAPHARVAAASPYLDLSAGFDAYLADRRRAGTDLIPQAQRKARKVEREVGPLRFTFAATDPAAFRTLLDWKRTQYRRTGAADLFALGWPERLLEQAVAATGPGFAGVLSTLHVGDRLAAVDLSLRSHGVMHSWFPAYDADFGRFSPGLIHLLELARAAAADGVGRLDLGKGEEGYKRSLMTAATPLVAGTVAVTARARLLRGGWYRARQWAKSSRCGGPVRAAARATRPLREWLAFR